MERNKSGSICSTPWSRTERVYSTPGVDLERNKCYSGVDPRLLENGISFSHSSLRSEMSFVGTDFVMNCNSLA